MNALTAVCLVLALALVAGGITLFAISFRRGDHGVFGLAGMIAMIVAAIPATVYASLSS